MNSPEIVMRSFAAKMLPPGDSASGFFYFEAKSETGDQLYVNGMREARFNVSVGFLAGAHALQPVIGMEGKVVILIDGANGGFA